MIREIVTIIWIILFMSGLIISWKYGWKYLNKDESYKVIGCLFVWIIYSFMLSVIARYIVSLV